MKFLTLTFCASSLLLSACTNPAPTRQSPPLRAKIEIMQPKVDVKHWERPRLMVIPVAVEDEVRLNSISIAHQGMYTAAECNASQTACKHAVVMPIVYYKLTRSGPKAARLDGTFDVTVGRQITYMSKMGNSTEELRSSINDNVEVIEEGKFSYPLSANLIPGQPYTVEGRLGTRVTFTLEP